MNMIVKKLINKINGLYNSILSFKHNQDDIESFDLDEPVVVSFCGGMGAQLVSSSVYYDLSEKGYKVFADLSYFSEDHLNPIQLENGLTHWNWQLDEFGIKKKDFLTLPINKVKKFKHIPDSPLKLKLAFEAFKNESIHNYFNHLSYSQINNIMSKYGLEHMSENYLVIHIRRGDYLNVASCLVSEDFFNKLRMVKDPKFKPKEKKNEPFPFLWSNLSCIRHINLVVQSIFVNIIEIPILFYISIHKSNGCWLIIKRTYVHNLNA